MIIDDEKIYSGMAFLICVVGIIKSIFGFFEHLDFATILALLSLMLVLRLTERDYKRSRLYEKTY